MGIQAYSHIALGVTDMDAAIRFYGDCLGMTVDADWEQSFTADQGAELHGNRAIRRRTAWLRSSEGGTNGATLTLDQMLAPIPPDHRADIYDLGIHHIAFWVSNVDELIERVRSLGYPVIMPHVANTKDYGEKGGSAIKSVFFKDPDGNLIQCDQRIAVDGDPLVRAGSQADEKVVAA